MDNKNVKPTFGVQVSPTVSTPSDRPEIGAIWSRLSKANKTYLNLKLNLTKAKLQELLAQATTEEVNVNLIAFPNDHKTDGDNKPNFRIYEEIKR